MAPDLAAVISMLTCPRCVGNGTLKWRKDVQAIGSLTITRHEGLRECEVCKGSGVNPHSLYTPAGYRR